MSEPALCTALITIIMITPITMPTIAWVRIAAANGATSSDNVAMWICGTAASASAAARPAFTVTGIARVLKGGAITMNTEARTSASMKAEMATASIGMVIVRAQLADQCRNHVEQVLGERDGLSQHPTASEHDDERDADELRHERERLLL